MLQKVFKYSFNLSILSNRFSNLFVGTKIIKFQPSANYDKHKQHNYSSNNSKILLSFLPAVLLSLNTNDTIDEKNNNSRSSRFNFIADVVEIVSPSIVQIDVYENTRFGTLLVSNGSGFIVSEDGIILTNAHVVRDKNTVSIKLSDGRKFNGQVVKVDPFSDVAAIKIDAIDLKPLVLANSSNVRPGEFVIALGSPLALSNSVTSGIVSNISRESAELGLANEIDYIQTDALITVGNSGGPLVDLDGKVIGMNTMKVITGISFAVPSNHIKTFLDEVYVSRASGNKRVITPQKRYYLGVKMFSLRPDIIDALKMRGNLKTLQDNSQKGCFIAAVASNSPCSRSGLAVGDIIYKVNEKDVNTPADIFKILKTTPHLHLSLLRDGKKLELIVNAEEY